MPSLTLLARRRSWVAAVLIVCGLFAYAPNLSAFFLSDDFVLLSWTHVHSPGDIAAFFDPHTNWFYRPVVKLVYWAGQTLFGLHAAPFHLLSLVLHGANAYLIYRLVARADSWAGWLAGVGAALVFLLDPHHAETVSWVSAVGDLLGLACILANLLLFRRFLEQGSFAPLVGGPALFAVGLLARETVALLPGLLLLFTLTGMSEYTRRWRRLLTAFTAYFAVLLTYLLVQGAGRGGEQSALARGGLEFHPLNLDSILLGLLDYAHGLVPGGSLLAGASLDTLKALVWVEWAVIVALAYLLWRLRLRMALFGLGWLLFTPLAFIFFSPPTDRYFYLPTAGYAILLGSLLGSLLRWSATWHTPLAMRVARVGAAAVLLALLATRGVASTGKVLAWKAAGQVSGGVLHDIRQAAPDPHDYAAFYLVNLPIFREGIPIFQNGLQEAVQLTYDNPTLAAHATDCATLQKATDLSRYTFFFQYKENGARQFPNVNNCPGSGKLGIRN